MNNIWRTNGTTGNFSINGLQSRLDSLLMVLKSCKGQTCVKPWETLHPEGNVRNLEDAMDPKYDDFYIGQPRVSFSECAPGYLINVEGPQDVLPFVSNEFDYMKGHHWSEWT